MKLILPITLALIVSSCGSMISYDYPVVTQKVDVKSSLDVIVSDKIFTTTLMTTHIGPLKLGGEYDNAISKLLDENQEYDVVIHPRSKYKTATIFPGITKKMERVTAKLGKYK